MLRRQLYVYFIFLALFVLFLSPHTGLNAQDVLPEDIDSSSLTPVEQPDMAYQPPTNASTLADFLPAAGIVVTAPPLTTTVPITSSIFSPISTPVTMSMTITTSTSITNSVPITSSNPVTTSLSLAASESVTSSIPNLSPSAPITLSTNVTLTQPITQLVSFADAQIALVFEENTLTETAEVQLVLQPLPIPSAVSAASDSAIDSNTVFNTIDNLPLQQFQLEVLQDGEIVSDEFSKPVRLIVDLRPLMQDLDASYQTWTYYLAYQDETNPDIWIEVPVDVYQADGLIAAEVTHFSTWASGVRPERWNPSWTPPVVSTFSGAATYSYPLELPPGRHGLQPSVSLSYNSRGLDGRIRDGESGPIADGWSLGDISVVRVGVRMSNDGNTPRTIHPDKFRLVFNGSGHELFPVGGVNTATTATVRYSVKDAPGYYVERNYDATAPNTDGLYWIVVTPDDTRYRLGYYADAEQWQRVSAGVHMEVQGHAGRGHAGEAYSGIAWNVDTVTDAFGNQMTYHYHTRSHSETMSYWNGASWQNFSLTTRANRINTIKYNYPTRVTTLPAADNVARLTSTPGTRIEFRPSSVSNDDTQFLINSIFIYHGSGSLPISEYRINSTGVWMNSPGCINYDVQPNVPRRSQTRVVKSIQRFVGTDGDATTNEPGYALPATTFYYGDDLNNPDDYDPLPHFLKNNLACFQFFYLRAYKNGYGGTVKFNYSSDNRSAGSYQRHDNGVTYWYEWPRYGFSYSVNEMRLNDGRNPDQRTSYSYSQPCYNQWGAVPAGALNCAEPNIPDEIGALVGYRTATAVAYDYNGSTILNKQITTFSQNATNSLGRPEQIQVKDAADILLTQTNNQYASLIISGLPNMFTYTSQTLNYQYEGGNSLSSKTTYEYNSAYQNNAQYGNLTHVREYDSATASTPYRTSVRWYYPRAALTANLLSGRWLVGTLGQDALYSGDQAILLQGNWYHYDYDSSPASATILPTQGALTRSRTFVPTTCAAVPGGGGSGCVTARQTIDTTFGYDQYGNQNNITSYSGYGYRTTNSSGTQVYNAFGSNPQTTTIAYESVYNLYPYSTSNGLGTTSFQIYGFNGVAVSGFQKQPGLLKQVVGPDGVTTKYEYDPFGRLYAVYDGYSFAGFDNTTVDDGDPVTRIRYWDTTWNNNTTFLNPAGNAPFEITEQQRPGSFPQPANSSSGYSFSDQTFFDGFGRPIQTRSIFHWLEGQALSREIISSTAYGANGQVNCQTVPYDVPFYADQPKTWPASPFFNEACSSKPRTTSTYDALGRVRFIYAPDGSYTQHRYALNADTGTMLFHHNIIDANQHRVKQSSNARGQLVRVDEITGNCGPSWGYPCGSGQINWAGGPVTTYEYNVQGNLTKVTDSANNITTMAYDNYGRKTSMTDPDMGTWTYAYDAAGNLTEQKDAKNQRLCFTYDTLARLTHKRHDSNNNGCDTSDVQLAYYGYFTSGTGKLGKPSEIRWGASSTQNKETFDYDSLGRLTNHTRNIDGRSYTLSFSGFDAFHRPSTTTYPNGQNTVTTYDREGANSLSNSGTSLVSNIRYNGKMQMTNLTRATGGLDTTYLYYPQNDVAGGGLGDSNYRLKTIQHGAAGTGNAWPDFTYEYDKVGNISKMTTVSTAGTDSQTFGYDHLNRLTSASASGVAPTYSDSYVYNSIGNITNFDGTLYAYNDTTHKHAVTHLGGVQKYWYDANGNMTQRIEGGVTYTQNFNVENELSSVVSNGSTTTFAYDAAGIRTKTVAPNGTITDYPFPGYEVKSPTSSPTVRITFSIAGQAVALKVMGTSTATYYLYNDHLGSTSAMSTTAGGAVTGSTARYYPFGNWRTEPTSNLSNRGFTGHMSNNLGNAPDDIGLIYMNARWYSPYINRFISADTIVPNPANPQSFNRYSYVRNSPLNMSDPTGHKECDLETLDCSNGGKIPPKIGSSNSWVDTDKVTMYQDWGNTEFSFGLGTENSEPVDKNGNPITKQPNYSYCNGFHCGIDQFAPEKTFVRAGISGQVVYIDDWNAYSPRYIVIRIGPDLYMRIAHLDASDTAPVSLGDSVTSKTIVGRVADYFGGAGNHVHIEFFTGGVGNEGNYLNPRQFMTSEFNDIVSQNRINADGMNFHPRSDGMYGSLTTQPSEILNRQRNFNANERGYTIPHGWKGHEHQD